MLWQKQPLVLTWPFTKNSTALGPVPSMNWFAGYRPTSWVQLFSAVDRLSLQGTLSVRRVRDVDYVVSKSGRLSVVREA